MGGYSESIASTDHWAKGLETMLYNKVHKHPEMAQQIKDYERASPTAPIRTYEWLSMEVHRTVNLEQMRRNFQERDDRMREMAKGKGPTQAAVGQAEEKPKREKKREKSVKAESRDQAQATLSPAREKGKAGKGAHANENRALGKGGNPSGDAPRMEGQNNQSTIATGSTMQMDAKGKIVSSNMTNGSRKRN